MRTLMTFAFLLTAIVMTGCGWSTGLTVEHDPDTARQTLITALDAWKAGQTRDLAKRVPPIRFADEDQLAGIRLIDYELEDDSVQILPFRSVKVELTLKDRQGEVHVKTAMYQVGVDPKLTVLRSDD